MSCVILCVSYFVLTICAYRAHFMARSAVAESRFHDVAAKVAQVTGGPNLFPAVNGFFLTKAQRHTILTDDQLTALAIKRAEKAAIIP